MPSWLGAHAENGVASPQIFHFNHCHIGLGGPKGVHRAGTDRQLKKHDLKEYRIGLASFCRWMEKPVLSTDKTVLAKNSGPCGK